MANRMNIVTPRTSRDGKTFWTKIGVAFETRDGGWSLSFEALPLPTLNQDGQLECRALLMLPRDEAPARPAPRGGRAPAHDDLNDSVPF